MGVVFGNILRFKKNGLSNVPSVPMSDSQVMPVLTDAFLSHNKSVCSLTQICFTSANKYICIKSDKYLNYHLELCIQINHKYVFLPHKYTNEEYTAKNLV